MRAFSFLNLEFEFNLFTSDNSLFKPVNLVFHFVNSIMSLDIVITKK